MNDRAAQVHNAIAALVQMYQGLLQDSMIERNLLQSQVAKLEQDLKTERDRNAVQVGSSKAEIPCHGVKG